jgi:four helix bundle protein
MEETMKGHRDLQVWQKAMVLGKDIYAATERFPKHEMFGLTQQLRRAAVSVPSNPAEGHGTSTRKEFHHFFSHARGSLAEVETQLEIAESPGDLLGKASEVARMLNGLREWAASRSDS